MHKAAVGWTVEHEPQPYGHAKLGKIKGNYGIVDAIYRWDPSYITAQRPGVKLGVIIRHPLAIARSTIVRKPWLWKERSPFSGRAFRQDIRDSLRSLDRHINKEGTTLICFEQMTTDPEYLESIARRLGIDEWDREKVSFKKVNSSGPGKISEEQEAAIIEDNAWFMEKYYG